MLPAAPLLGTFVEAFKQSCRCREQDTFVSVLAIAPERCSVQARELFKVI